MIPTKSAIIFEVKRKISKNKIIAEIRFSKMNAAFISPHQQLIFGYLESPFMIILYYIKLFYLGVNRQLPRKKHF
jgi:hypothetical protein